MLSPVTEWLFPFTNVNESDLTKLLKLAKTEKEWHDGIHASEHGSKNVKRTICLSFPAKVYMVANSAITRLSSIVVVVKIL